MLIHTVPGPHLDQRVCHSAGKALYEILGDEEYLRNLPPREPDGK